MIVLRGKRGERTIVILEARIVGQGSNIVALGQKIVVLERLEEEHTKRHAELLYKLDAAEQQHEVAGTWLLSFLSCLYCFSPLTSFDLFQGR
jgi:hypothetical protein